jgi:mono/diheme cytochrome c family protein
MKRRVLVGCFIALTIVAYQQTVQPQQTAKPAAALLPAQRALLDQYCVTCHNQKTQSGGLALDRLDLTRVPEDAETWEKVVRKLRAGLMPPAGARRPDAPTTETLTVWLEGELDRSTTAAQLSLSAPGLHRLNRTEYANAIRDLLSVEVDVQSLLPPDDSSFGFDNMASSLSVSSALLEGYLAAASKISRLAVGDTNVTASQKTFTAPADLSQNEHIDGLPFGTRGGMLIRHHFPVDGEYLFQVALLRGTSEELFGRVSKEEKIELSVDGERVKLFDIDAEEQNRTRIDNVTQPMQVRAAVPAGLHSVGVAFIKRNYTSVEDVFSSSHLRSSISVLDVSRTNLPHISSVIIGGPFTVAGIGDTPSRKRIFECRPSRPADEARCAEQIISTLTRRAFRRPSTPEDLEVLMNFYEGGRAKGTFDEGIELVLRRIIASPEFIFRAEREPANLKTGGTYRITDTELASRLSFFLWSTIPDDELLKLAGQGKLQDPVVLEAQVRRMLADPRANELVRNFAGQWLYLRNLDSASPDIEEFPGFDDNLRQAFRRETELFFDSMVREDRSVLDLLTADYTFANQRLAEHYGIPNVYGSQFRRVALGPESPRRGLLGHGSILTVTSLATRTSPVARGKWVLENILGTPPPEPPANVPPLEKTDDGAATGEVLSLRKRMEAHRTNPACSGCHRIMDPIGFSLENFDAIGKWRTKEGSSSINASGELADGTKVDGPLSLQKGLMRYSPQFVRTVTGKLLTYALGRGVQYYDMPLVRRIVKDAARQNYRFSSVVLGIVKSAPFQMRTKVQL